jgi:antitoxin component of RelBE/YafQ-DinJ toxin-antitoxin module
MKSKLTLRLDDRLKERAKRLAEERGTSVSKIVEDYFRLLLREPNGDDSGMESMPDENTVPDDLPPRTRQMVDALGPATTDLDLDDDTEAWVDAMHEKHK